MNAKLETLAVLNDNFRTEQFDALITSIITNYILRCHILEGYRILPINFFATGCQPFG